MIRNYRSRGFTLVELMLAVTFISILLISIVGVVMQIASVYNKGLAIKSVNQASITIADDMKRVIGQTKSLDLSSPLVYHTIEIPGTTTIKGGRLCTGTYTYAWNISNNSIMVPYNRYGVGNPINSIVRFKDPDGQYCQPLYRAGLQPIPNNGTVELFSDDFLKIQSFAISEIASDDVSRSALYQIKITVSSGNQNWINATNSSEAKCYDPGDARSNNEFCAVNQIKFTALAGKMEIQL